MYWRASKILLFLSVCAVAHTQNFNVLFVDTLNPQKTTFYKQIEKHVLPIKKQEDVKKLVFFAYEKGFLECSLDTIDTKNIYLFLGKKYESISIQNGNIALDVFQKLNLKKSEVSFFELEKIKEKTLNIYENSGYPFAKIYFDSAQIDKNISLKLYAETGSQIIIDSVVFISDNNKKILSDYILYRYLQLKPAALYNERSIKKSSSNLKQIEAIEEYAPAKYQFNSDSSAVIYYYIKERKLNTIDAILGLMPNSASANGKILLTGQVKLQLSNIFKQAEHLSLTWNKLQPLTQELKVGANFPFIYIFPIGVAANFSLYKRDTTTLDVAWDAQLLYKTNKNVITKAFFKSESSNILSKNSTRNSNYLAYSKYFFGTSVQYKNVDDALFPTKGIIIETSVGAGIKKIPQQTISNNTESKKTIDSLNANPIQWNPQFNFQIIQPIRKKIVYSNQLIFTAVVGKNILQNEKYRIGGKSTLRGFDEQSLYSEYAAISRNELRFIFQKNTYFYPFFDVANLNIPTPTFLYGFGGGFALRTKGGTFDLTYALGKYPQKQIDFKTSKIHFGYLNYF